MSAMCEREDDDYDEGHSLHVYYSSFEEEEELTKPASNNLSNPYCIYLAL
jgi:hypothetical protein